MSWLLSAPTVSMRYVRWCADEELTEREKAAIARKPAEHRALFHGNTDDHFRLGVKLTRQGGAAAAAGGAPSLGLCCIPGRGPLPTGATSLLLAAQW